MLNIRATELNRYIKYIEILYFMLVCIENHLETEKLLFLLFNIQIKSLGKQKPYRNPPHEYKQNKGSLFNTEEIIML